MAEPFLSEIRMFSFDFPPKGWAFCNGQFLPINQNQALFSLLGTRYGGNGQTTFALPNLQGRTPIHMNQAHTQGEAAGAASSTISIQEMPAHNHFVNVRNEQAPASQDGVETGPTKFLSQALVALPNNQTTPGSMYGTGGTLGTMKPTAISNTGGSQAHNNMMPYLVLNFSIALQGIFPSQN